MADTVKDIPLETRAAVLQPSTFNAEQNTIDVVFSTGARGLRFSWDVEGSGYYYEQLDMSPGAADLSRLNAGASVLNSHNAYSLEAVIGVVVPNSARLENGKGIATLQLSSRPEIEGLVSDIKKGIIRNVSIGYSVEQYEVMKRDGDYDTYTATKWCPREISFVPVPFDAGAQARNAGDLYPCRIINQYEGREMDAKNKQAVQPEDAPEGEVRSAGAEVRAATEPVVEPVEADTSAAVELGRKQERSRQAAIRSAVAAAKLDVTFADKLIEAGIDENKARSLVLDELAKGSEQTMTRSASIEVLSTERDNYLRSASDWLIRKANVADTIEKAGHKIGEGADGMRGASLMDIARDCLEQNNVRTRGLDKREIVTRAFAQRSAYQGTSDFAVILENTLHKVLMASYAITQDTWMKFCKQGTVSDFRAHNRYLMGTFSVLDSKLENGEFKSKQLGNGRKESITGATKGNIIGITREAIINDDMQAFNSLATMLGRAAKLTIEADVYATLALNSGLGPALSDGKTLFHADHKNIGTGAALSAAAIDADAAVMEAQTDINSNEILAIKPSVLLLPRTLRALALSINNDQYDPDSATKAQRGNYTRGIFDSVVATTRLSGTRRYLFADANVAPVLEVAFLDGMQEPYLEMRNGFEVDGVEWKVRLDYGVGGVGYHGAVTNAGV